MHVRLALSVVSLHRKDVYRRWLFALTASFGLASIVAAPARAQERPGWRIVEQSGEVELIGTGARPVALTGGTGVGGGERIRTGADGRVVLRRSGDLLIVAPNSLVQLPAQESAFTRVMQLLGSIFVRVEPRGEDGFEVQTPFLVAVVKGTIFAVSTEAERGRVHVAQGLVEVRDPATGATYSLATGQTLQLGGGAAPLRMSRDPAATSLPATSRLARDVAASTGGLRSLDVASSSTAAAADTTAATASDPPPGVVDIAPSAGLLRGLGGNRARGAAPPPAPAPPAAKGGGVSGGAGGSGGPGSP